MQTPLTLRLGSPAALLAYVNRQLNQLFPDQGPELDAIALEEAMPDALERMRLLLQGVRSFQTDYFDHFHSLQYASFLYLLGNVLWRDGRYRSLAERLYLLNRSLNALDFYCGISLPPLFFISHGLGAVLGNAQFGNRLVIFQNVTVGRIGEQRPVLGDNVILYPGATVTGDSVIGNHCVIGAGVVLHRKSVPDHTVVALQDGVPVYRPLTRDYAALYWKS
jgi:serine O-acetyltransferase